MPVHGRTVTCDRAAKSISPPNIDNVSNDSSNYMFCQCAVDIPRQL